MTPQYRIHALLTGETDASSLAEEEPGYEDLPEDEQKKLRARYSLHFNRFKEWLARRFPQTTTRMSWYATS